MTTKKRYLQCNWRPWYSLTSGEFMHASLGWGSRWGDNVRYFIYPYSVAGNPSMPIWAGDKKTVRLD